MATSNPIPLTEPEARALADAIIQVSTSQPRAEALKFVDMALARAPEHPVVLNAAGGYALLIGMAERACDLYRRAIAVDPKSQVLWLNLANAYRSTGDPAAEGDCLERALAIQPRFVAALLHKAELLERSNRPMAAVQTFEAALASLVPYEKVPDSMAPALSHAREVVGANYRKLADYIDRETEPVRRAHSGVDHHRYDACRDILLGRRRPYASLPKDTYFPYLPAVEFFRREDFPWLSILEDAAEEIAAEASAVFHTSAADFSPYVNFPPGTPIDQWGPLNKSADWSVYSLWQDGAPNLAHQAACPRTTAVLAKLPMCDVPEYAPGAYFSVLKPHTQLPPHTGTTNTRAIVHLPLVIPPQCRFRVGSETRTWEKGRAWVFDDTIEHDAANDSDENRIILIFDVWNPYLSDAERDLIRAMTVARGRHYGADAPTMGSR